MFDLILYTSIVYIIFYFSLKYIQEKYLEPKRGFTIDNLMNDPNRKKLGFFTAEEINEMRETKDM